MLLSKNAQKIQDILDEKGFSFKVLELPSNTRTAQEAADTIGCTVAQILKSLIFRTRETKKPVLVLASGINRVNEKIIARHVGEKIEKADAEFTKQVTGFAIGGIPPLGHTQKIMTYIDEDLLQYDELWAAAGMPNAVFSLTPEALEKLSIGEVISIK